MKNLIEYMYKININTIESNDNYYIISDDSTNYLFKEYVEVKDIMYIYQISNLLNQNSRFCFKVMQNVYNTFISDIDGVRYYLVDIGKEYRKSVDFLDMISFYNTSSNYLTTNIQHFCNWDILWESKLDYFFLQSKKNDIKKSKLSTLFYFYVGIAENALLYLKSVKENLLQSKSDKICFNHRRIVDNNSKLNFYNPFNFIVDFMVRDIAEYLKYQYYNNQEYEDDLVYFLKTENLTNFSASLLYARIIYPSYFFDYYESNDEKTFFNKFYDPNDYIKFIKKTYELISSYVNIIKIDWL